MNINITKLKEYVKSGKIIEFNTDEECLKFVKEWENAKLKTVEDLKFYQGWKGFNFKRKRYVIVSDLAFDVYII